MGKLIDIKPNTSGLIDIKPSFGVLEDIRSNNLSIKSSNRIYNVTLGGGMLIGFGPAITYPQSIDVLNPKSQ